MFERAITASIEAALERRFCVGLYGPRQTGKSTLARQIADGRGEGAIRLDLRRNGDCARLLDPTNFFNANAGKLIVLDEIQYMPEAFDLLHAQLDDQKYGGIESTSFLILGSSSHQVTTLAAERLGARAIPIDLTPLRPDEVLRRRISTISITQGPLDLLVDETAPIDSGEDGPTLEQLWLRGGLPDSLMAATDQDSLAWRQGYLRSYGEIDFGDGIDKSQTMTCLERLAAHPGRQMDLSREPGPFRTRIETLSSLGLVRVLRPWHRNGDSRLTKAPRCYIRDSGLLHALRQRTTLDAVLTTENLPGGSWEGFCIEAIASVAEGHAQLAFYRAQDQDEVDLVIEFGGVETWVVEIKLRTALRLEAGFFAACDAIKPSRRFAIFRGATRIVRVDGIEATPLPDFLERLQERIS